MELLSAAELLDAFELFFPVPAVLVPGLDDALAIGSDTDFVLFIVIVFLLKKTHYCVF